MNLLSSKDLSKEELMYLFNNVDSLKNNTEPSNRPVNISLYGNKILINVFFEPSTRTSLSFQSAMSRLGGNTITFNKEYSSINKGESIEDTIQTLSQYGDIMVIRHPEKGIVSKLSNISSIPIINGGDGNGEHPTQAIVDLYTIYKKYGSEFINKTILFVGDILNSRTIHSLINLINLYPSMKIYFLPFKKRNPPEELIDLVKLIHNQCQEDLIIDINNIEYEKYDIIYCTRLQKERQTENNYEEDIFTINNDFASNFKEDAIILHPLPRNNELDIDVDSNKRAWYFKQAKYGVDIRMAIIDYCITSTEKKNESNSLY